jgi:Lrp/AsnC family leucine-responsive transcriptional regulator
MSPHIDQVDYKILTILQADGKITNVQLAEKIGLAPASTLERVRKLEMQGFIKSYYAQLDPHKLSLYVNIWLQVCLNNLTKEHIKIFQQAIDKLPEVVCCYQVIGDADFLLNVLTTDMAAYQDLLINKLSNISPIKSIRTMSVLATCKESGIPLMQSDFCKIRSTLHPPYTGSSPTRG